MTDLDAEQQLLYCCNIFLYGKDTKFSIVAHYMNKRKTTIYQIFYLEPVARQRALFLFYFLIQAVIVMKCALPKYTSYSQMSLP